MKTIFETAIVAREALPLRESDSVLVRRFQSPNQRDHGLIGSVVRYLVWRVTSLNQCAFMDHAKIDGSRFLPAGGRH
jgi:hypothetical protein